MQSGTIILYSPLAHFWYFIQEGLFHVWPVMFSQGGPNHVFHIFSLKSNCSWNAVTPAPPPPPESKNIKLESRSRATNLSCCSLHVRVCCAASPCWCRCCGCLRCCCSCCISTQHAGIVTLNRGSRFSNCVSR